MSRTTPLGEHAIVIGGSMAGLLAAGALSDHFAAVTVVERDRLPDGPEQRKGVPQARHVHAFWAGGLQSVQNLLPGLRAELLAEGAVRLGMPTDLAWLTPADRWTRHFEATQEMVSASRTLLEWVVRRRVRAIANVHFLTEREITALLLDRRRDVRGVTVRDRTCGEVVEIERRPGRRRERPWVGAAEVAGRARPADPGGVGGGRAPRLRHPAVRGPR